MVPRSRMEERLTAYGAGTIAARGAGADILDPRPFAVGTIAQAYARYPHIAAVLPALGYSDQQRAELEETLRRCPADAIVDASRALRASEPWAGLDGTPVPLGGMLRHAYITDPDAGVRPGQTLRIRGSRTHAPPVPTKRRRKRP